MFMMNECYEEDELKVMTLIVDAIIRCTTSQC